MFSSAINTSLLTTYLVKTFVPALENELQFQKFTQDAIIPPGGGKIGRFNVFSSPPETTTPLPEGSTTANEIVTYTTTGTDCTIQEYGEFVAISSLEELAAVEGTRSELIDRFAYGGAKTLDTVVRTQALTTTTAAYALATALGVQTTAAIPQAGSAAAIIGAASLLRTNSARGFTGVSGHPEGDFAAIVTPLFERQMVNEGTTGRLTWGQAVTNVPGVDGQIRFVKGYMGRVYGTACYRSQNLTQTTVTSLSDNNFVLAKGGLGAVAFKDMKATIVLNDVNSPYKNKNSIAHHAFFGAALIDSLRVVRLYSGPGA